MSKRRMGLYDKYKVVRTDGTSRTGGKNENARHFVLSIDSDPHALPALRAYINSCTTEYPALAEDLGRLVREVQDTREQTPASRAQTMKCIALDIRTKQAEIVLEQMLKTITDRAKKGFTTAYFETMDHGGEVAASRLQSEDGFKVALRKPQVNMRYAAYISWD